VELGIKLFGGWEREAILLENKEELTGHWLLCLRTKNSVQKLRNRNGGDRSEEELSGEEGGGVRTGGLSIRTLPSGEYHHQAPPQTPPNPNNKNKTTTTPPTQHPKKPHPLPQKNKAKRKTPPHTPPTAAYKERA